MMLSKGVNEHIRKSYFWLRGSSGFANGLHKNQIHWGVLQLHGSDADNSELGKVDKVAPAFPHCAFGLKLGLEHSMVTCQMACLPADKLYRGDKMASKFQSPDLWPLTFLQAPILFVFLCFVKN